MSTNPELFDLVESIADGNTHVSIPHADIIGSATVSEHCPTHDIS